MYVYMSHKDACHLALYIIAHAEPAEYFVIFWVNALSLVKKSAMNKLLTTINHITLIVN